MIFLSDRAGGGKRGELVCRHSKNGLYLSTLVSQDSPYAVNTRYAWGGVRASHGVQRLPTLGTRGDRAAWEKLPK
jgi:hypothetical protein